MSEESPKPQVDEFDDICRHGRDLLEEECVPCATLKIRCEAEHWEKEAHEKSEELCALREQHSQDLQAREELERKAADLAGTVKLHRLENAELKVKITSLEAEVAMWQDLESQKHMEHNARMAERDVARSELKEERERAKGLVEALEFYGDHWGTSNTKIISDGYKVADLAINKYRSTEEKP